MLGVLLIISLLLLAILLQKYGCLCFIKILLKHKRNWNTFCSSFEIIQFLNRTMLSGHCADVTVAARCFTSALEDEELLPVPQRIHLQPEVVHLELME
jgi:hypothetical protein